ncbi:MAG: HNH endonuclease [Nitrospinota bacterium]|nr:HNH endonuclease [Nitrospinota bacterium]
MEHLRSLVLNSTYEPLQFTSARRALILFLLGKAEALEFDGFHFRTCSTSYRLPTVIKLRRFINRPYKASVSFSKKNVLRRDGHTCQYCGATGVKMTIDHVIPRSRQGESTWENVVAACRECNLKKGNRPLSMAGMRLLRQPRKPKNLLFTMTPANTPDSHVQSWAKYLTSLR